MTAQKKSARPDRLSASPMTPIRGVTQLSANFSHSTQKSNAAFFDALRERFITLLTQHVEQLTVRGDRASGRCPLHEDRHPSFSADLEKCVFYCFSCHATEAQARYALSWCAHNRVDPFTNEVWFSVIDGKVVIQVSKDCWFRRMERNPRLEWSRAGILVETSLEQLRQALLAGLDEYLISDGLRDILWKQIAEGKASDPKGLPSRLTVKKRGMFCDDQEMVLGGWSEIKVTDRSIPYYFSVPVKGLPKALAGVNVGPLIQAVEDLSKAIFGVTDWDLTNPKDLREILQTVVNLSEKLTRFTTSVVEGWTPWVRLIIETAEGAGELNPKLFELVGNISGMVTAVNKLAPAGDRAKSPLTERGITDMANPDRQDDLTYQIELLRLVWLTTLAVGGGTIGLLTAVVNRLLLAGGGLLLVLLLITWVVHLDQRIRALIQEGAHD